MARGIITLTTDFGLADHFAGAMKGVILGIFPQARIVDISHQVTPFDIAEAGFLIAQAYPHFPKDTIHVVVVDPGVGTSRRPIAVKTSSTTFIAPDNGVLSMIYNLEPKCQVRHITARGLFLKNISNTFHGRDVFAPVAAHLAKGLPVSRVGKPVQDYLRLTTEKPYRSARRGWTGAVLNVDRFGNLITNYRLADFPELETRPFEMSVGLTTVERLAQNYAECAPGELFLISGSSGFIEVSSSQASAAKILGCGVGAPLELRLL